MNTPLFLAVSDHNILHSDFLILIISSSTSVIELYMFITYLKKRLGGMGGSYWICYVRLWDACFSRTLLSFNLHCRTFLLTIFFASCFQKMTSVTCRYPRPRASLVMNLIYYSPLCWPYRWLWGYIFLLLIKIGVFFWLSPKIIVLFKVLTLKSTLHF